MKKLLLLLLFIPLMSIGQDLTKEKEVNNLFSIAAGGTPTTIGITYERILNNRKVSLEIGAGLLGGGSVSYTHLRAHET